MYQGQWALVTGASAGLGKAFALELAQRGANVVLVARREDRLTELAGAIDRLGTDAKVITADLSDPAAPMAILDRIAADGIQIDILINNAGFGLPGTYAETTWEDQQKFIELMVTAYAALTHHLLPGMIERDRGRIINVASLAGIAPGSRGHTLYGASKAFLIHFSQSLAAETHGTNVKVSAFCPGFTLTEFHDVNDTRDKMNRLPGFMVMKAYDVADRALDAMERRKTVYVPGTWNKFIAWLSRFLPMGVAESIMRGQSARMRRTGND